jgi:hypothetical protein
LYFLAGYARIRVVTISPRESGRLAMPGSAPNTGNFFDSTTGYAVMGSTTINSSQNYLTAVGAYTASASPYEMGGDVYQWNDTLITLNDDRGLRGGAWNGSSGNLVSSAGPPSARLS